MLPALEKSLLQQQCVADIKIIYLLAIFTFFEVYRVFQQNVYV